MMTIKTTATGMMTFSGGDDFTSTSGPPQW